MNPPSPGRRFLVTGGAGFIGSHLCEALLAGGHAVTVLDDLSTGRRSNLDRAFSLHAGAVEFVEGTVSAGLPALEGREYDGIFHLAAAVGVRLVVADPAAAVESNVLETIAVLAHASRRRTPVLLASSSEVYGKGAGTPFREGDDLVFGPPSVARWSYGLSKAIDEQLALAHAARDGLPVTIARFFNTVGPRQRGRYGMVLPRFVAAALDGAELEIHGSGEQVRCFCDVRDVAQALPRMLAEPRCRGRVFNVGSDRPTTINELAATVLRVTGSRSAVRRVAHADVFGPGFEDLAVRVPDISLVRAAIGFDPAIGIERTVQDIAAELSAVQEGAA